MITVYFLPVHTISGVEVVAGIDYIHDSLLQPTDQPMIRKLIQDTTVSEHDNLDLVCVSWRSPTQYEINEYNDRFIPPPPSPDYLRACEILSNPAIPIPAPDLADLVRIFGRRLGYIF